MALNSVVHRPTSPSWAGLKSSRWVTEPAFLWSVLLVLFIGGPWLAPGYLFGTDWPAPRHFDFPTAISSSAPLRAALAAIATVTSAEVAGKVLILGALLA